MALGGPSVAGDSAQLAILPSPDGAAAAGRAQKGSREGGKARNGSRWRDREKTRPSVAFMRLVQTLLHDSEHTFFGVRPTGDGGLPPE